MLYPDTTQVPHREYIYVGNVMSQVWLMFFQKLADTVNLSNAIDLIALMQLAHQLPVNAMQAQTDFAVSGLQNTFSSIPINQIIQTEMPLNQAVFLCPEKALPLLNLQLQSDCNMSLSMLPSSEIIHD